MFHLRNAGLLSLFALGGLLTAVPVGAQNVVVGTADTNFANNIPFGTGGSAPATAYIGEYEQLYSGTAFSGPVSISTVSFSSGDVNDFPFNGGGTVNYDVTIYLSNTTATDATLSSNFSANYGSNRTQVFSGTVPAVLTDNNSFDLNFAVTPFIFDSNAPAGQNLLFDVFLNSDDGTNAFEFFQGTGSTDTSSVFYSDYPENTNPVVADGGLLTQFTVAPTPEPSPLVVFALAAAGTVGLIARKRRVSNASA